ncbi:uncharacterized protein LOC111261206 [Varroa jacobsoni]|uniref:uncharacterized protein LOC111261206 n=1 Tax=Varroa jacobsoni TaxID=62625 RepID=UPI000BF36794|nr:uncharacterized protein LOC111261206 [Varroa jacobsoni]
MAEGGGVNNSGTANQKTLPRGVLARSGLPLPTGTRLNSSIRAPRDLTLGGKVGGPPKKCLAPNLIPKSNVSLSANGLEGRENGRSGVGSRGEAGGRSRHDKVGSGFRGRGRGDGNRGRGRGRGPNLVQLDGIFVAGSTPPGNCGHSGEGAGSSGLRSSKDSSLPKYIPMEQEDCENTKETISRLTRADFTDYGDEDEECELPLMIPLTTARYGTTCKVEDYTGPDETDLAMEADSSETERIKPLKVDKSSAESDPSDIARNLLGMLCLGHGAVKADDEGTTLTVFQLPRLPGPSKASQDEERRLLQKDTNSCKAQTDTSQQYKLRHLSKGYLGKLQVLRDGRVRMVSGRVSMELQMASELPLYQELVEIQGRMVIPIAKVENKVVCRLNPKDLVGESTSNSNVHNNSQ